MPLTLPDPHNDVPGQRRLFAALVGLTKPGLPPVIQGIPTAALAHLASIPTPRAITAYAEALAERGVIAFTPGTARRSHSYTITCSLTETAIDHHRSNVAHRLTDAMRLARKPRTHQNAA